MPENPGQTVVYASGAASPDDPIRINLLHERTLVLLKSWLPDQVRRGLNPELFGATLPSIGETATGEFRILCLAPDEWLLVSNEVGTSTAGQQMHGQFAEHGLAAVDLSHSLVTLGIEGREARAALAKGCGLDLHRSAFPPGLCAQTRFAQLAAIVDCVGEQCFELYVGRSYSWYMQRWLTDSAAEFR